MSELNIKLESAPNYLFLAVVRSETMGPPNKNQPAQTAVHITFIMLFPGPDAVTLRNEPSRFLNAILEAFPRLAIAARSLLMNLVRCFQVLLKNYWNSFASPPSHNKPSKF